MHYIKINILLESQKYEHKVQQNLYNVAL